MSAGARALGALLLVFVLSRLLVLGAAEYGSFQLGDGRAAQPGNVQRPWYAASPRLERAARWDAEWYLLIAAEGYHLEGHMAGRKVRYAPADATGFFPLYPLLIRGIGEILAALPEPLRPRTLLHAGASGPPEGGAPYLLAGILISNAALLGAAVLLYRRVLATGHAGRPGSAGMALFSAAALLLHPSSFFLSAVYAESLLLFLTLACFAALRTRRWWTAALLAALASATKPAGLLLAIPALVVLIGDLRTARSGARRGGSPLTKWLTLAFYPAGTLLHSAWCQQAFGDPLAWVRRQMRWRGALSGPWRAFQRWAEDPQLLGAHHSTVEALLATAAIILMIYSLRRRPPAESALAAAVILPPLCATLWSFGRLSLQAFPVFIVAGAWANDHRRWSPAWFLPSMTGLCFLTAHYAAWWWAG
jgi:hypothetical protein